HHHGKVVRTELPVRPALPATEYHRHHQGGGIRVGVHHRTAGEVKGTPPCRPPLRAEHPVRHRRVHQQRPRGGEQRERAEPPPLRGRSGDQCESDHREHHLEQREQGVREPCRRTHL